MLTAKKIERTKTPGRYRDGMIGSATAGHIHGRQELGAPDTSDTAAST